MQECFSLNFPLREYFFCTSRAPAPLPPPPTLNNFSNGPSLNSNFEKEFYCIDHQHGHLVT